jgi:transposase
VVKPTPFANAREGWNLWEEKLSRLDAAPSQIVIGMEATSRYHENLYHELEQRGYQMRLLHPGQTHHFHQQRGLRAKTDRLDAMTIARTLLSGEARIGYIPGEQVATYRELVRLHTQLSEEAARYENQIQALVVVLFPEVTQVFADPCGQTALAVLKAYPHAQALAEAGVEAVYQVLRTVPAPHFGRPTAQKLVTLAKESVSSGRALRGRASSLRILCDQLEHTQANLTRLEQELEQLITTDPGTKGLQQMPELGPKTIAVLRAELGEVDRFACTDQAIAYAGMDIKIRESGKWKGQAKLSRARQWVTASDALLSRHAQHSPARLCLWRLLPASGGAWTRGDVCAHGSHAQNGGSGHSSDANRGGLRSRQSLGRSYELVAPTQLGIMLRLAALSRAAQRGLGVFPSSASPTGSWPGD